MKKVTSASKMSEGVLKKSTRSSSADTHRKKFVKRAEDNKNVLKPKPTNIEDDGDYVLFS